MPTGTAYRRATARHAYPLYLQHAPIHPLAGHHSWRQYPPERPLSGRISPGSGLSRIPFRKNTHRNRPLPSSTLRCFSGCIAPINWPQLNQKANTGLFPDEYQPARKPIDLSPPRTAIRADPARRISPSPRGARYGHDALPEPADGSHEQRSALRVPHLLLPAAGRRNPGIPPYLVHLPGLAARRSTRMVMAQQLPGRLATALRQRRPCPA